MSEIFNFKKTALSDQDLRFFCNKNDLQNFSIVDLQDLFNKIPSTRYIFIFTGNEPDKINNGHDHHWIFANGKEIFDSYGDYSKIELPEGFFVAKNTPNRLQEFNSDVCGQYCCAYFYYIEKMDGKKVKNPSEKSEKFSEYFGFGTNRRNNDERVLNFYKEKTKN